MPKRTPLFLIPILLACFCACGQWPVTDAPASPDAVLANASRETPLPVETPAPTPAPEPVPYTLLIEEPDYIPARYEPASGCYLGAYILPDKTIGGSIRTFESITGKSHAIYVNEMVLGGEYPLSWVLECIAARTTPCLVVNPSNAYEPFDYTLLEQTARDIGRLNVPVFVQVLPFAKEMKYDREGYLSFFTEARRLLGEYAPQAALVWAAENTADSAAFYPGDENVDWVGVCGAARDDIAAMDEFIQAYQRQKPIMLTGFGVSHYSTENSDYKIEYAAMRLADAYADITKRYPRVKAVLYRNENELDLGLDEGEIRRDFTVTTEETLTAAYAAAIADERLLSALEKDNNWRGGALMNARGSAYDVGGVYYISEASITEELGAARLLPGMRPVSFGGEPCQDFAYARACVAFDFYVDAVRGWVVVRLL